MPPTSEQNESMPSDEQPGAQLHAGFRPVESSNLAAIAFLGPAGEDLYEHEAVEHGALHVIFKNGTRWEYRGVPKETAHEFLMAESVGKYFNANIKGNESYPAFKVEAADPHAITMEGEIHNDLQEPTR